MRRLRERAGISSHPKFLPATETEEKYLPVGKGRLIPVENLSHFGPPLIRASLLDGNETGGADFPPFLRCGIVGHLFHIRLVIVSNVFIIAEQ
jgi:hypothetical protein